MHRFLPFLWLVLFPLVFWAGGGCEKDEERKAPFDPMATFDKQQKPVYTRAGIDSVLNTLEKIDYSDLTSEYRQYTWCDSTPFRKTLKKKQWYRIQKTDPLKFLVGKSRIRDFMSKDKYYPRMTGGVSFVDDQYLCLDRRLLYKILEAKKALQKRGWDPEGFRVLRGHRNPKHNLEIGGKSRSRHIFGEAVDIEVLDLDGDGAFSEEEKQWLYGHLNAKIVGNSGGLGKYPGTPVIHLDVRGRRARW